MNSISGYISGLSHKLTFKILMIFAAVTVVAGALLYVESLRFPLPQTYGQAIATVSLYKLQTVKSGVYIYAVYALLVIAGVVLISGIYSRRVARPFKRIKELAAEFAKGNFAVEINLSNNGEVHPLQENIGRMVLSYSEMREKLQRSAEILSQNAHALEDAFKRRDDEEFRRAYDSLTATAKEMEKTLSGLKL